MFKTKLIKQHTYHCMLQKFILLELINYCREKCPLQLTEKKVPKEYYSFIEDYWAFTIDFKKMKVKCLFQYTYTDVLFH